LEDQRNVGERSCNFGDRPDQRVQSLVFIMMMMMYIKHSLQEVEAPRFLDNQHMVVVRLSALCSGRLYSFLLQAESTTRT